MRYLQRLDELISTGADDLSPRLCEAQRTFLEAQQNADGGFGGREGPSDLYYTDFGLRAANILPASSQVFASAGKFLRSTDPGTIVETFNLLNGRRILSDHGVRLPVNEEELQAVVGAQRHPKGGYGRPDGTGASSYQTFLGHLCLQMMGGQAPDDTEVEAMLSLQHPSGGFTETPGETTPQTSATAAALSVLLMENVCDSNLDRAMEFLCSMQSDEGGLQAHPEAPRADLLSTFTGLVALAMAGQMNRLDMGQVARFLRTVAHPDGGFGAHPYDARADVEYTYYGLGCLALCRGAVGPPYHSGE